MTEPRTPAPVSGAQAPDISLLTVVTLDEATRPATVQAFVVDQVVALLDRLRRLLASSDTFGRRVVVLVVAGEEWTDPLVQAGIHAVRGAILSLAVEVEDRARLNVVVVERVEDADATLAYLAEPEAGYITGSTFNLVRAAA